ncbi:MAG: hypothetical protein JSV09_07370 [Thermoplasmata archaeon]|nr:MAG: hypothetical protein JSV09_07370 [Thermoplasmata archaeon]
MKKRLRLMETRMHYISIFMVLTMIVGMFSTVNFVYNAKGHIDEGVGDPLQLYSYFDSDANTKINFADDGIGRNFGNYDEWEGAYVRDITITNFAGDDRFCYLFLANDDSFLYIGIVYQAGNTGASNYVRIYFDEGSGVGNYDGTHDDALTANNENYVESTRNEVLDDGFFNGGSWVGSPTESSIDLTAHVAWGVSYMNYEFKIPIDNGVDSASGSDLNIGSTDELGIFFEIGVMGVVTGEVHYWDITGNDPTNVNDYGDLRLGLEKKDATVYSTFANTGNPIIDGDISNDFAYANAYSRDITMTNFLGETFRTTLYLCEDPSGDDIFIGVVIYTDNSDSTDYLRIYTDQDHSVGPPFGDKDGILSDGGGQNTENYEEIGGDNSYTEGFWDSSTEVWVDDSTAADAIDGEGEVSFKNFAGSANDRYEFEFRLPYSPASSSQVDGPYDFYILSPQLQGILFEFYDDSAPVGEKYFYWDLTVNLNAIKTRATAGGIFLSTGWAYLQTGGPALKPITPITGSTVFGTDYVFRVEAEDEDGYDGVNFVGFQIEGQTNWISLVRESTTNGIWFTYWDTTAMPDGSYNITIVAQDNEGIAVKKVVRVTIANGATLNIPPTVSLNTPSSGSTLSGTVQFLATSTGIASVVEFHLDGLLIGTMSSTGLDSWQYFLDTTNWGDGVHIVNLVAKNAAGEGADAGVYIFDNWDLNSLTITAPPSGSSQSGQINVVGDFAADNSGDSAELFVDDMFWSYSDDTSSGTVTFTLDTTLLSEGAHQIKMFVYDPEGNKQMDMVTIIVDNWDLDTLTITTPTTGSTVNETISVVGDFTDDISGEYAELFVDEVFWSYSDDTSGGDVTFSVNTELLSEGPHQVKLFVYDPDGNKLMDMVTIYVDNIPPGTPTIASLIDGQFIHGTFVFKVQVDTTDLDSVQLTIPTVITDMPIGYNGASGYYEYTLDTTALSDGEYSVSAVSWDTAGSSASSGVVNFKIDNNAPELTVASPLDNAIVSGDVDFVYNATDAFLSDVMYKIYGNSWVDINTTWDTTTFSEGEHMVSIIAMDESGHYTMITLNLVVDNNAPEVAILNPVENQFLHDDFTFKVRAKDDVGLADVRITIQNLDSTDIIVDDISIILNEVSGHYEYKMDTMTLDDGNYSIMATSYDISGKDSDDVTVNFMVDNHAPILMLIAPLNGELLTGSVEIEAEYSDVFLVDMVYRVDGGAWVDLDTAWDTTDVNDGTHTIEIKLTDEAGHVTTQMVTVDTDNHGPDLYPVTLPEDDTHVGASFFTQVFARDAIGSVDVFYKFDEMEPVRMFENKATGFFEAEIVTDSSGLDLEDGNHNLTITATDSVNTPTEISRKIFVDNTGPTINLEKPKKAKTVSGNVRFIVTLTDDTGIDSVYIRIDKRQWKEMREEDGQYIYNWNSRKIYNGKYDVDIKASDTLGNEMEGSSDIKVDNFPMIPFIVFIIVLVVLLVFMVVNWTKGPKTKRPKKAEKEPIESEIVMEEPAPEEIEESAEEIDNLIEGLEDKESDVSPEPQAEEIGEPEPQEPEEET